jgi:serine/threonine-protein kinase
MKPQNIMITNVEGNPWFVKILDFGLVRALVDIPGVEVITSHGELWGTPEYMAPEQLTDTGKIDHRCDLYAVGVILLEMLTGQAVFRRKSMNEIFSLKLDDKFDPLSTVEPHKLSQPLELFFRKVLDSNPEKRFRNAGEMREALVSAIEEKVTEKLSVQSEKNANVVEKDKDENKGVQIKEMEKEFERERDLTKLGQYILIGLGVIALIIIIFWLTGIL